MNNQAFSKIWILIIIVILLAGGILAWQPWRVPKEEVGVPEEGIPEKTVNWEVFSNSMVGMSFKYPKEWNPIEIGRTVIFPKVGSDVIINISSVNELKNEMEECVEELRQKYSVRVGCRSPAIIGKAMEQPDLIEKQFQVLEKIGNTGAINEQEIKKDFFLMSYGIDSKMIIETIKIPKLNVWGLKLVGRDAFDVSTGDFYYRVVFLKDEKVVEMRLEDLYPLSGLPSWTWGPDMSPDLSNEEYEEFVEKYEQLFNEFFDAVRNNTYSKYNPAIQESFDAFKAMIASFDFPPSPPEVKIQTGKVEVDIDKMREVQRIVESGSQPWRLDPKFVVTVDGLRYGFTEEDFKTLKLKSQNIGVAEYEVAHEDENYIVVIIQPVPRADKIWTISEVKEK